MRRKASAKIRRTYPLPNTRQDAIPRVSWKNYDIVAAMIPEMCAVRSATFALSVAASTTVAEGFADWCLVDLLEEDVGGVERLRRVEVAGGYGRQHAHQLRVQLARHIPDLAAPYGPAKVVRTSQPQFIRKVTRAHLSAFASDERHLELLNRLDFGSCICVPLRAARTLIGAMTFIRGHTMLPYNAEDVTLANTIASLCGLVSALQCPEAASTNGSAGTGELHPAENGSEYVLSTRQREVLRLVRDGMKTEDIAKTLYIAHGTVKGHLYAAFRALGVENRTQAVLEAQRLGEI